MRPDISESCELAARKNKKIEKNIRIKTHGWHLSEEGANLIVAISSHMNNNRLSSNVSSSTKKLISHADC